MNDADLKYQEQRIERYKRLQERLFLLKEAREEFSRREHEPGSTKEGESPFTGNTRDSREIAWLKIGFTKPKGGGLACDRTIDNLMIDACDFGRYVVGKIDEQIRGIYAAMKQL